MRKLLLATALFTSCSVYAQNGGGNGNSTTTPDNLIESTGNIGIGTTSPTKKLEVVGESYLKGDLKVQDNLILENVQEFYNPSLSNGGGNGNGNGGNNTTTQERKYLVLDENGKVAFERKPIPPGSINSQQAGPPFQLDPLELCSPDVMEKWTFNAEAYSWLRNPNNNSVFAVCPDDLKIGIGTYEPTSKLTVQGRIESKNGGFMFPDGSIQTSAATNVFDELYVNNKLKVGASSIWLGQDETNPENSIWTTNGSLNLQPTGGMVGIGTNDPEAILHVSNTGNGSVAAMYIENVGSAGGQRGELRFVNSATESAGNMCLMNQITSNGSSNDFIFRKQITGGFLDYLTYDFHNNNIVFNRVKWGTAQNYGNVLIPNGRVGIGTNDPQSELAVNGTITAKKVEVTLDGWSDYVFEPTFNLKTLNEVEEFITNNKHLPDVPSEKEVMDEGIELGEMNKILLQKIEELTLYTIQQQKEIDELKKLVK